MPGWGCDPGHRRGGIVQHAYRDVVLVVHRIGNARHATGEESGIAHERKSLLARLHDAEALRHCDTRTHAQASIDGVQRLRVAQRITADIAAENTITWLLQGRLYRIERATMRAARAQQRRAGGRLSLGRFFTGTRDHGRFSAEHLAGLGASCTPKNARS